jgi:hypothetical protein
MRIPTTAAIKPPITGRMSVSRFLQISHACLFNFASNEMRTEKESGYSASFSEKSKAQNEAARSKNSPARSGRAVAPYSRLESRRAN